MFKEDLAHGKVYERIALDSLGSGSVELPPPGAFSDWDFKHNDIAYEVKSDRRCQKTGNLCIEYEHTNKPSGISISKADVWIYYVLYDTAGGRGEAWDVYHIPVDVLKERMVLGRQWNTDGGNSRFWLVKADLFEDCLH